MRFSKLHFWAPIEMAGPVLNLSKAHASRGLDKQYTMNNKGSTMHNEQHTQSTMQNAQCTMHTMPNG